MVAAFDFNNLSDSGTITGSSAAAQAGFDNLKNKHVGRTWVGTSGATENLTIDLGSALNWDTLALLGTNMNATATTRVRASNSDPTGVTGEIYDSTSVAGR